MLLFSAAKYHNEEKYYSRDGFFHVKTLRWRHNDHAGVSNHQPRGCLIVYSGVDQRKQQSSASLAFVREIHRGPVNFPQKWPVTRKMFPFDDVIMNRDGGGRGWWDWFTPYLSVLLISCLKRMLKHSCIWCRFYERIRPQSLLIMQSFACVAYVFYQCLGMPAKSNVAWMELLCPYGVKFDNS